MITLRALQRQIASAEDLQSVVKTMKAMAAVNIRQYEQAVESLQEYVHTVELGWAILLKHRPRILHSLSSPAKGRRGLVLFGSEQGLCGQFNDVIEGFTMKLLAKEGASLTSDDVVLAVAGDRMIPRMRARGVVVDRAFRIPSSMAGVRETVGDALIMIESWRGEEDVNRIDLFFNRPQSGAAYDPQRTRVYPLDIEWLRNLGERPWKGNTRPTFFMPWESLLTSLVRETIAVSLHRAFAESLAAENASRLASMQAAEGNIDDRLEELRRRYHQQRQRSTTEELLDIIGGFEALRRGEEERTGRPA